MDIILMGVRGLCPRDSTGSPGRSVEGSVDKDSI